MPKTPPKAFPNSDLIIYLDTEYQKLMDEHYRQAPKPNTIPVGGSWMDYLFKAEALRGCIGALRQKKSIEEAIVEGETVSEISVKIWNSRREYQVQRWEKTASAYLRGLVSSYLSGK